MAKKEKVTPAAMKKPKWKVGDTVTVEFLGHPRICTITELRKNPQHIDRWIYEAVEISTGRVIPHIGIDDSEKVANIYTKVKKDLDVPND